MQYILTKRLYRGQFIRNYKRGEDVLLIHADRTKPVWLFRNLLSKKATFEHQTRTQAAEFIQTARRTHT